MNFENEILKHQTDIVENISCSFNKALSVGHLLGGDSGNVSGGSLKTESLEGSPKRKKKKYRTYQIGSVKIIEYDMNIQKGEKQVKEALKHENKLGAGAKKRKKLNPDDKFETVMKEFEAGTLHSGSGEIITDKDQALAIAYSESRKSKKTKKAFEVLGIIEDDGKNDFEKALNVLNIEKGNKTYFSTKEREELAKKKQALSDGSFPIRNTQDLKDAIKQWGRAKDPAKAKRWIKKRAKELGTEDLLPEHWD